MKLTVLGTSGSLGAPGNPASGYLLTHGDTHIVADMGPGVLAQLQQHAQPSQAHVVFSHLHPDHCLDFPSLIVWRRYHPTQAAPQQHHCIGPADTVPRLGLLSGDTPGEVDPMADTFHFAAWEARQTHYVADIAITPYPAIHPIEAYSLRFQTPDGTVLAYSGDSAYTEDLIDCAAGAKLFLCEATWGASSEGKAPNMHMSGAEAGKIARLAGVEKLVLVHIPPWGDPQGALAAAQSEFNEQVELAIPGATYQV